MILTDEERYKDLSKEEIRLTTDKLLERWADFVSKNDPALEPGKDYFVHDRNIFEVIKRTDKRKVYYHVFHRIDYPLVNERKEIAIIAYWINTLKPFIVTNKESVIFNSPNERFALYLILGVLAKFYKKKNGEDAKLPELTDEIEVEYTYYFKYCDVSRESMIQFVEMLASLYGVGNEPFKKVPTNNPKVQ